MDEIKVSENYSTTQYIVIQLGDEKYGIDIKYVDNILKMQRITRVPRVPRYLSGVINLRGEVVTVMDIRTKMDLPKMEETKNTRIIILKLENVEKIGVIVDEVKEVVTLGADEVEKNNQSAKEETAMFVSAVGKVGSELVSLLDLHAVVAE